MHSWLQAAVARPNDRIAVNDQEKDVSDEINHERRRFFGSAAMTLAAA